MRYKIRKQLRIVEPSIDHEHAQELHQIRMLISKSSDIFEMVHADLIRNLNDPDKGREGMMSAEQVFKALLIKQMNSFSYKLLSFHLKDSRTYRAFCGFGIGDELPSESTLQRDIKKLRPETLEKINRIILGIAAENGIEKGRKVRVDCTVVESNIHKPTDSSLLYDLVRVLARLTSRCKEVFGLEIKFVNHTRLAKKCSFQILNTRGKEKKKKPYTNLLNSAKRAVGYANEAIEKLKSSEAAGVQSAKEAHEELCRFVNLGVKIISQTERRVLQDETVPSLEKVVSIFEPHTDIIVKDRRATYYGHKIAVTGGMSGLFTDLVIWEGNPADSKMSEKMIERQHNIYGRVPLQATYDGGFASKDNLKNIKTMGVKDVVFAKKRGLKISDMAKSTWVYKRLRDFRAGIEGMISYLKRCFGMNRCTWRGFESFKAYTWSSVVTANLLLMARKMLT